MIGTLDIISARISLNRIIYEFFNYNIEFSIDFDVW